MRLFIGLALCGLFFGACNSNNLAENEIRISGNFPASESVALSELGTQKLNGIDTVDLDSAGNFEITFNGTEEKFYLLGFNDGNSLLLLAKGGQDIVVNFDTSAVARYTVTGSENSNVLRKATAMHEVALEAGAKIERKYNNLFENADESKYDSLTTEFQEEFDPLLNQYREDLTQFIEDNKDSPAIIIALYQRMGRIQMFNINEHFDVFKDAAKYLTSSMPNSDFTTELNKTVEKAKPVAVGMPAPDFTLTTPTGEQVSLSDYKGKMVLVDFWASWCRPCRAENPNIVEQYNRFKDQGFEVLGVSLDGLPNQGADPKGQWIQAIEDDNLDWTQVSDLKGWGTPLVQLYNFNGIPHSVLINEEGIIVAKNLRGDALGEALEDIYNS